MKRWMLALPLAVALGCSSSGSGSTTPVGPTKTDDQFKQEITTAMHDSVLVDIEELVKGAEALQAAAPLTTGRGWDAAQDAAAINTMKDAWGRTRRAYEHVEGALAPLFPDIDASIDERYDGFLEGLGAKGDEYLFDDQGVTGMHAVERILWSGQAPQAVVDFEKTLPGYKPAAMPATEQEAADFKNKLCAKVVSDAKLFRDQWTAARAAIDIGAAFQGLIGLMNEQREKVNKAAQGTEESRYCQRTMLDLRWNLEGTLKIYKLFQPWLASKSDAADAKKDGPRIDKSILTGFDQLDALYKQVQGDAIPQPPSSWSAENPSQNDLLTPFGKLYTGVKSAADPAADGSIVAEMNLAADVLKFPLFKGGK